MFWGRQGDVLGPGLWESRTSLALFRTPNHVLYAGIRLNPRKKQSQEEHVCKNSLRFMLSLLMKVEDGKDEG